MQMTLEKFLGMIAEGRGLGTGDRYQPWEQVTRRRSSPFSNLNVIPVPHLNRLAHFLSRGEREFGLLLWWLGAEDVREQFPLWPWPHRQPLDQIKSHAPEMAMHPGMANVAKDAGIRLSHYPGLHIPVVLSLDFLTTVPPDVGPHRLLGFSCKPLAVVRAARSSDRLHKRLELDRLYCAAAEIPHHLIHPEQISKTLVVQLHWLAPIEPPGKLKAFVACDRYRAYLDQMDESAYARPVVQASHMSATAVGWGDEEGLRALRIAIWYQHLDVDLMQPVSPTRPLRRGGLELRERLQRQWFGRPQ